MHVRTRRDVTRPAAVGRFFLRRPVSYGLRKALLFFLFLSALSESEEGDRAHVPERILERVHLNAAAGIPHRQEIDLNTFVPC